MIRIGETHAVIIADGGWWHRHAPDKTLNEASAEATLAVKRLVEELRECRTDLMIAAGNADDAAKTNPRWEGYGAVLRARVAKADAALSPFTDSDVALVDSGLRSCATPENDGSTPPKGADQ